MAHSLAAVHCYTPQNSAAIFVLQFVVILLLSLDPISVHSCSTFYFGQSVLLPVAHVTLEFSFHAVISRLNISADIPRGA